ncbi:MAG: glycosyltransferase family 2 protein [Simkaniaceae bacterium]|nr:MAG: glycosyltransferase family 2 protein [Simkaniaceae bacterium]
MSIYVIILNWNGKEDTLHCLKSLSAVATPHEVVVVDNGSTDDSIKAISKAFPKHHLIATGKNLGYAEGNNVGIRYALEKGAASLLILNNDTIVTKDFLEGFLKRDLPIQGGKGHLMDEPFILDVIGAYWSYEKGAMGHVGKRDSPDNWKKPFIIDYVSGAAMFIQREVFEKIGLFDPRFFLNYEEVDFCFRAKKAGFPTTYCPEAVYFHKKSASFTGGKPHNQYFVYRNRLLWIEKTFPPQEKKKFIKKYLKDAFQILKKYLEHLVRSPFKKNARELEALLYCKAILYGTRDYLLRRFGDGPKWLIKPK